MIDISIIIASYNTKDLLQNCLDSIFRSRGSLRIEVVVVDNASSDGSVSMVKKSFPKVTLIRNRTNLLYSKANNQGLRIAKGKYVLILNSDTLMHKDSLPKIKKFMDKHPKCGLSSCREIDGNREILDTCHRFPSPITELLEFPISRKLFPNPKILQEFRYVGWTRRDIRKVDTVPGSFMFGRRKLLEKLGFFDEKLPLFYSDADLCLRVNKAGHEIWHNGKTTITHYTARSLAKFSLYKSLRLSYKDMVTYYKKHYGIAWAALLYLLAQVNLALFKLRYYLISQNSS